jgi:hypothetical protein
VVKRLTLAVASVLALTVALLVAQGAWSNSLLNGTGQSGDQASAPPGLAIDWGSLSFAPR